LNSGKVVREKELVVASIKSDDTSWLSEELPEWKANVYVVDDPNANLTVPFNKGHETMAYLTSVSQIPERSFES